jgi:DNA repair protein RadC
MPPDGMLDPSQGRWQMSTTIQQARLRLKRFGASQLTDAELLALLIGRSIESRDALDLASGLLKTSGGLSQLSDKLDGLRSHGLGEARIARIGAALEFGRRCLEGPTDRRRAFSNPSDAARCFHARLAALDHEVFSCLFLDTRHRMIRYEALFRGTIDGAAVYPREIVKQALGYGAAAVILGHNHPSGDCEPSEADRSITLKIANALALVDIRLLDHLVVSSAGHVSLAERGWI